MAPGISGPQCGRCGDLTALHLSGPVRQYIFHVPKILSVIQ